MSATPSCSLPALTAAGAADADPLRNADALANADPRRKSWRRLSPAKYRPKVPCIERFTNTSRSRIFDPTQSRDSTPQKSRTGSPPHIRYKAYQNAGEISGGDQPVN